MTHPSDHARPEMDPLLQECLQNCASCHNSCLATVSHCLELGGAPAASDHIRLLLDCAELCQTSANFMLRDSLFHGQTCGICAEVCVRCAEGCARFSADPALQACAEACRRAAASCRRIAELDA